MDYSFVYRNGHVAVYDECGNFAFSADTMEEAYDEAYANA
jgi:hypothetical protein